MKALTEPDGATPLEPEELEGLKFKHVTTRGQLDHLEHANIEQGLRWLSRKRKADILNEEFVRELHRQLFGEVWSWAGKLRLTEKNIGVDPRTIPVQLRLLLDDAKYWVEHGTYPPLEAALRFHHRLVFIHPFPNGNGRFSRIMADALCTKIFGVESIDWAGGHDLQKMNVRRTEYIESLRKADGGDLSKLFEFGKAENSEK